MKYARLSFLFLAGCAFLSGCTTVDFVRKDTSPAKQGVLRYDVTSDAKKEEKYRAEVDKKASEFCGSGGYKITREYQQREETGSGTGIGTGFGVGGGTSIFFGGGGSNTAMYNFVEFACK